MSRLPARPLATVQGPVPHSAISHPLPGLLFSLQRASSWHRLAHCSGTTSLLFLRYHQVQLPFVAVQGTKSYVKRNQSPSQSPLKPILCHIQPCSWDQSIKVSATHVYHHLSSCCSLDAALLSLCFKTATSKINFIRLERYIRAIIFYFIILIYNFLIVLSSKERSHYSAY